MIHLLKFFLNSIRRHGFGLIWKEKQHFKIFELDMRRVVERQYSSVCSFFCVASRCMKLPQNAG